MSDLTKTNSSIFILASQILDILNRAGIGHLPDHEANILERTVDTISDMIRAQRDIKRAIEADAESTN
jgi:hypothetical protein